MEERYAILKEKYFPVPLKKLVAKRKRTFPLYIYLELNQRLVLRYHSDHELTEVLIRAHLDRGLEQFWCPRDYLFDWQTYLLGDSETPAQDLGAKAPEAAAAPRPEPRSEQSALAVGVMNSEKLDNDQKRTLLSQIGTEMLSLLATADSDDPKGFERAMQKCRQFTDDIIKVAAQSHEMSSIYDDIRLISESEVEHSTAVATLAVIFAMGAGFSERELLADVAFASFLHDIGVIETDPELLSIPIRSYAPERLKEYKRHVEAGLKFLEQNSIHVTPAVREIIEQHHERFDGNGFPKGIQGLQLNELAQVVSLADQLHDIMTGRMDGTAKTPQEALASLQKLQNPASATPTYFNPELYHCVLQMIEKAKNSKDKAPEIVDRIANGL